MNDDEIEDIKLELEEAKQELIDKRIEMAMIEMDEAELVVEVSRLESKLAKL